MTSPDRLARYVDTFAVLLHGAEASADNRTLPLAEAEAFAQITTRARKGHSATLCHAVLDLSIMNDSRGNA
jgi:hypothetical protein